MASSPVCTLTGKPLIQPSQAIKLTVLLGRKLRNTPAATAAPDSRVIPLQRVEGKRRSRNTSAMSRISRSYTKEEMKRSRQQESLHTIKVKGRDEKQRTTRIFPIRKHLLLIDRTSKAGNKGGSMKMVSSRQKLRLGKAAHHFKSYRPFQRLAVVRSTSYRRPKFTGTPRAQL